MTIISILDFRRNAAAILRRVQRGEDFVVTYRGKPAARLEPIQTDPPQGRSLLRAMCELAKQRPGSESAQSLTNEDIDRIVYGQ